MGNKFIAIDTAIIRFVEKGAHSFQKRFRRTNFWIAKWIATVGAFEIFFMLYRHAHTRTLVWFGWIFTTVFIIAAFFFANHYWKIEENKSFIRLSKGRANPQKMRAGSIRFRGYCLLILSPLAILDVFSGLLYLVDGYPLRALSSFTLMIMVIQYPLFMYLIACDPLPPRSEKATEKTKSAPLVPEASS